MNHPRRKFERYCEVALRSRYKKQLVNSGQPGVMPGHSMCFDSRRVLFVMIMISCSPCYLPVRLFPSDIFSSCSKSFN